MNSPEPFNPQKAMWLTLPGAAMCSIPIGMWVAPMLFSIASFPATSFAFNDAGLLAVPLIPVTAITSRRAYKHCISTTGCAGTRIILMVFNYITRGLADLCLCFMIVIGMYAVFS